MNTHVKTANQDAGYEMAAEALEKLREWTQSADPADRVAMDAALAELFSEMPYPALARDYPQDLNVDEAYRASLPDLQNGAASLIRGARKPIQHVGISNFRLPLRFVTREGDVLTLETSVTGSVRLDADKKGINMSRIMRSFYKHSEETFGFDVIAAALDDYKDDLASTDARIALRLSYPQKVESLRSGLAGWQYYEIAFEMIERQGARQLLMHLDYVYSSTCPCSLELSEHARRTRGQLATPHSQRSVARLSVALKEGATLRPEDLIDLARRAVPTETQVMVKREDEQAFAELNAANPVFVEDAARLFAEQLECADGIEDFRVVASHQESLHSHDAVSVLTQGPTFEHAAIEPHLFASLVHPG